MKRFPRPLRERFRPALNQGRNFQRNDVGLIEETLKRFRISCLMTTLWNLARPGKEAIDDRQVVLTVSFGFMSQPTRRIF